MHRPTTTTPVADQAGLDYQRCRWCHTSSYRRLLCPVCASPDLDTFHCAGVGVVTRPPRGTQPEATVQMREGFTLQGRIVGGLHNSVYPGAAVRLTAVPDHDAPLSPESSPGSSPGSSAAAEPTPGAMEFRLCDTSTF